MFRKLFWVVAWVCLAGTAAVAQDAFKVDPQHYKLDFENERVQVVYIRYGPHETSPLHAHPAGVVVYLTDGHFKFTDENGKVQEASAKRGEARWFAPFKHRVENLGDKPFEAIYIAVKDKPAGKNASGKEGP